jgi:vacuolar protein-sorting-associated protein 4
MDMTFIPKGIELVKQAVNADNNDKIDDALKLYKQALAHFIKGMKYMDNQAAKDAIIARGETYMTRAEEISAIIQARDNKKNNKKDEDEETDTQQQDNDPDTVKLTSALASTIVSERPNVPWDAVAGLEEAKSLLKESVVLPNRFPELFTGECKPWKGILLYGPPGTGKSFLAKAVATECGASCFLSVSSSDLVSKYQGESERLVKHLFELARKRSPAIIFIDEVDSLCSARGRGGSENDSATRIVAEFLKQMDGVGIDNTGVLILGATNTPWVLDEAIRRRFERRVYIPLPDLSARMQVFKTSIGTGTRHTLSDVDFKQLAASTDGLSGADIGVMVKGALYEPLRTCQLATHFKCIGDKWEPCSSGDAGGKEMNLMEVPPGKLKPPLLSIRHFQSSIKRTKPSVGRDALARFESWTSEFGQFGNE